MSNKSNGSNGSQVSVRQRIGAAQQVVKELLSIPEWDVTLELRGITLGQRSRIMREGYTNEEKPRPIYEVFYPLLLQAGCYDPSDGKPVFAATDSDAINELNPAVVDRVARVLMRLSGLSTEGTEKNDGGESQSDTIAMLSPSNLA